MFRIFRPTALFSLILLVACTTTMVSDRNGFVGRPVDPDFAGIVNPTVKWDRAPASVNTDWANVPGFVNPDDEKLTATPKGVRVDREAMVEYGTPSAILKNTYLRKSGTKTEINLDAIQSKIDYAKRLRETAEEVKASKKIQKALDIAQIVLKNAKDEARKLNSNSKVNLGTVEGLNSRDVQPFYSHLFQGLEMLDVARSEDPIQGGLIRRILLNLQWFRTFSIEERPEAMNLDVPYDLRRKLGLSQEQAFFHPSQLKGVDLSTLDPVESGMWRKVDNISSFDTGRYDATINADNAFLASPSLPVKVTFDSYEGGGSTAKMDVKLQVGDDDKKFKMKFRTRAPRPEAGQNVANTALNFLMNMSEVHTETVVNNLAAALGYNIAPTYFKQEAQLYLNNDEAAAIQTKVEAEPLSPNSPSREELVMVAQRKVFEIRKSELINNLIQHGANQQLAEAHWDFADALKESVYDMHAKRWYIKVKDVSLEERVDNKFGFALKANMGRTAKREFRAFALFLAWISDDDGKDANSDVRYTFDEKSGKVFLQYVSSDMGASLGFFYGKDAPHVFRSSLVSSSSSPNKVELTFKTRHFSPIFHTVSLNDAKWFARKLAQLTDRQFDGALSAAGYDLCTADVLKKKLQRRRDQLVAALGLQKEGVRLFDSRNATLSAPYAYTPPSDCAKYFQDGKLVSTPELARNGQDIDFRTLGDQDSPLRSFAKAMKSHMFSMAGTPIGNRLQRHSFRVGKSFFDGVLSHTAGQVILAPARYVIPNPFRSQFKENSPPYWIVGISRFGVGSEYLRTIPNATARYKSLSQYFNDVSATFVKERIEIQPAWSADVKDTTLHYYQVFNPSNIAAAFDGISGSTLESMKFDSSMVVTSTYVVAGASIRSGTGLLLSGPFAGVGFAASTVNRTAVMQENEENVLAVRSVGKGFEFKAEGGWSAVLLQFPVLSAGFSKEGERQVVFRLPRKEKEIATLVKGVLDEPVKELGKTGGQYVKYLITDKELDVSGSRFKIGLFGFANWYTQSKHGRVKQVVTQGNQKLIETVDVRVKGSGRGGTWANRSLVRDDFSVSGVLVSGKNVETVTNWNFQRTTTTRKELARYAARVFPVFPMSLRPVPLDNAEKMNNNLVAVDFEGQVTISETGWNKVLSKTMTRDNRKDVCKRWLAGVDLSKVFDKDPEDAALVTSFCDSIELYIGNPRGDENRQALIQRAYDKGKVADYTGTVKNFVQRFEKATQAFAEAGGNSTKLRDSVVNLLYIKELPEVNLKVLKGMMSAEDYAIVGHLESNAEGGLSLQQSEFEGREGELKTERVEAVSAPGVVLHDFASKAFSTLEQSHAFFDYFFIERVGNRLRHRDMEVITETFSQ